MPDTPNSAADPWSSLGEAIGIGAAGMMGAGIGSGPGGGGANLGALSAMGRTVDDQQKMKAAAEELKYKQALMKEAEIQGQSLEAGLAEKKKKLADQEAWIATLPEGKRALARIAPETVATDQIKEEHKPGLVKFNNILFKGKIPEDVLAEQDFDVLKDLQHTFGGLALAGNTPTVTDIDLGDGRVAKRISSPGPDGKIISKIVEPPHPFVAKGHSMVDGIEHDTYTLLNPNTGKPILDSTGKPTSFDAGAIKMGQVDRQALAAATNAMLQTQDALNLLGKLPDVSNAKMLEQYGIYSRSKTAGLISDAGDFVGMKVAKLDPQFGKFFAKLGQLDAIALRAYMKGRPNEKLYERIAEHIPKPGEPADILKDKLEALVDDKSNLKRDIELITGDQNYYRKMLEADAKNSQSATQQTAPPPTGDAAPPPDAGGWKYHGVASP